jgi:hypothetical protein
MDWFANICSIYASLVIQNGGRKGAYSVSVEDGRARGAAQNGEHSRCGGPFYGTPPIDPMDNRVARGDGGADNRTGLIDELASSARLRFAATEPKSLTGSGSGKKNSRIGDG